MARYEEIATDMRRQLMQGSWGDEGDQIPTVADLMKIYRTTSSQTVRAAQMVLIKEGLLIARQGRGVFIAQRPSAERMGILTARDAIQTASQQLLAAGAALAEQPLPLRVRIDYNGKDGIFAGTCGQDGLVVCEVCSQPISSRRPGLATFPAETGPRTISPRFVHKGSCDLEPGASCYELDDFLLWLRHSLVKQDDDE